jgi:hypothetical protein
MVPIVDIVSAGGVLALAVAIGKWFHARELEDVNRSLVDERNTYRDRYEAQKSLYDALLSNIKAKALTLKGEKPQDGPKPPQRMSAAAMRRAADAQNAWYYSAEDEPPNSERLKENDG